MAKIVDHNERKREIAEKAVRLFSQVGYDNVSLIMVAAEANVSRSVLYRYFSSKREVMDAAILLIISRLGERFGSIIRAKGRPIQKLESICNIVVEVLFGHRDFMVAIFNFVTSLARTSPNLPGRINEFTGGLRHMLLLLIAHARRNGEIKVSISNEQLVEIFYAQFESCVQRIVTGYENDQENAKKRFSWLISALSNSVAPC